MLKSKTLACLLLLGTAVSASHCLAAKPALLGPSTKDGDTKVTTWA